MVRPKWALFFLGTVVLMSGAVMLSAQAGSGRSGPPPSQKTANDHSNQKPTDSSEILKNAVQAAKNTVVPGADSIVTQVANDPTKAALGAVGLAVIAAELVQLPTSDLPGGVLRDPLFIWGFDLVSSALYAPETTDVFLKVVKLLAPESPQLALIEGIISAQALTFGESTAPENPVFYFSTPVIDPAPDPSFYQRTVSDFIRENTVTTPAPQQPSVQAVPTRDLNSRLEDLRRRAAQADAELSDAQRQLQLQQSAVGAPSSPRNYTCHNGPCSLEQWQQQTDALASPNNYACQAGPCTLEEWMAQNPSSQQQLPTGPQGSRLGPPGGRQGTKGTSPASPQAAATSPNGTAPAMCENPAWLAAVNSGNIHNPDGSYITIPSFVPCSQVKK